MSHSNKTEDSPAQDATTKFKVLCCHGFLQNGTAFRSRIGSLRRALKSRVSEFVFVDAPLVVSDAAATATVGLQSTGGPSWWSVPEPPKPNSFDRSFEVLRNAIANHRPDGLLGFSQGASSIALLLARLHRIDPELAATVRFVVLFAGFPPTHPDWEEELRVLTGPDMAKTAKDGSAGRGTIQSTAAVPVGGLPPHVWSLHVMGEADEVVPPARARRLVELFESATGAERTITLVHEGGHLVPSVKGEMARSLRAFLDTCADGIRSSKRRSMRE